MQLEQLRYWLLCLPTLIPHGSGTSLPLELGWGRNSASLQLVAESDSAGKEPLSFLHCSLPVCLGLPGWCCENWSRRVPFSRPAPFDRLLFTDPVEDGSAGEEAGP